MRLRRPWVWPVCASLCALTGCAFVLDFDALKEKYDPVDAGANRPPRRDDESAPNRDASIGTAAEGGTGLQTLEPPGHDASAVASSDAGDASLDAGDASDAATCGPCEAPDPCSVGSCVSGRCVIGPKQCVPSTRCVASVCEDGACVESPLTGLVKTAFSEVVEADTLYRSELIAAGDRFFRATYGKWNQRRELRIQSFVASEGEPLANLSFASVLADAWPDTQVASPPAIVAETALKNLQLFVYAAIENVADADKDGMPMQLVELLLTRDLTSAKMRALSDAPNYHFRSHRAGPSAAIDAQGKAFVVWEGCSVESSDSGPRCVEAEPAGGLGGVYFSDGLGPLDVAAPGDHFVAESRRIFTLNALSSKRTRGAIWLAQDGANQTAVRLGFEGAAPNADLTQCGDAEAMSTGYALNSWRMTDTRWGTSMSTRNGSTYRTEVRDLTCGDTNCTSGEEAACATFGDVKSQVSRTWQREGDPALRLLRATARASTSDGQSQLVLGIDQLDLSDAGNDATPISELVLATGPADGGPDWASLAPLGPNLLAVSWLEPGTPDTLHVETYDVCAP